MAKSEEIAAKPFSEPVKLFRLRKGFLHKHATVALSQGDEIYLNQRQAKAFRDKFEEVDSKELFKEGVVGPPIRKIVEKQTEKSAEKSVTPIESDKKST